MTIKTERLEIRSDEKQIALIDAWASRQEDDPSRSEAIRRLIAIGLSASTDSVAFTDGEKAIILMMADVFKALKIKEPNVAPDFLAEAILGGHYWAPKWQFQGLFHEQIDDPQDVHYVVNVLDMWDFIEGAVEDMQSDQLVELQAQLGARPRDIKFGGFDGNTETRLWLIAKFLIDQMGRFSRFKRRELNSHIPTTGRYQNMVELFEPLRKTLIGKNLTSRQLVKVLK